MFSRHDIHDFFTHASTALTQCHGGAMTCHWDALRSVSKPVRRAALAGLLLAASGGSVAAHNLEQDLAPRCKPRLENLVGFADDVGWAFSSPEALRAVICPNQAVAGSAAGQNPQSKSRQLNTVDPQFVTDTNK